MEDRNLRLCLTMKTNLFLLQRVRKEVAKDRSPDLDEVLLRDSVSDQGFLVFLCNVCDVACTFGPLLLL